MNALTITQTGTPVAPSVIGFRLADDRVVGFRDLAKITWSGLLKASAATGIAAAATAVRGAHVALAEIEDSRAQLKARVETLQQRNSDLATALIEAQTQPARKRAPRWTAAERAFLADAIASAANPARPGYAAIAWRLAAEFNRPFTAASLSAQARKHGMVPPVPAQGTKAPGKPMKTRRAA